ncbi:unnamed protein product [Caenorhabditis brenneri]
MAVQLVLTEKMIKYIHKGQFQQLLNEHQEFFKDLSDNLKIVVFPKKHLSGQIPTKMKFLLTFLEHPRSNDPECPVVHDAYWGWSFQKFFNHLKYGVVFHDWRSFYESYRPTADYMIREARMQEVIDFRIELGSSLYENVSFSLEQVFKFEEFFKFEARDLALAAQKQEAAQNILRSRIPRLSRFFSRGKSHKPAELEAELTTETTEKLEHQFQEPLKIKQLMPCDKIEQSTIEPGVPTNPQLDALKELFNLELSNLKTELEKSFSHKLNEIYTTLRQNKESINNRIAFNRNDILMEFNEFATIVQKKQSEINASSVEKFSKLELRVQEQLKTQEESIKLREEKLKVIKENLENRICEVRSREEVVIEIQRRLELQEDQMKSREGKLKLMEEKLEEKLIQIEMREKHLDTKLVHVLELLKLNIEAHRLKTIEDTLAAIEDKAELTCSQNNCSVLNTVDIAELESENFQSSTDPIPSSSPLAPPVNISCSETTSIESLEHEKSDIEVTLATHLLYDEELQKMEDEFQKRLAEQKEANELELQAVQKERREKNKKNQEELRRRFGNLYAGEGSSQS